MKVKVIGSGSMWNKYNSASYLIDKKTMVDFPNGTCKNLFRFDINPNSIEDIVITHFHGDHYFDIPFYFLLKSKYKLLDVNIYCGKEGKRKIKNLLKLAFPNSTTEILKLLNLKYEHKNIFELKKYSVERVEVEHGRIPSYGYIFKDNEKYIGFTGDTALCENVEYMSSKCDYLFCDCMFPEGTAKHMGIDNLKYLSEKYPQCTYVVSHMEIPTREKLIELKIENIIVPEDGQEIII